MANVIIPKRSSVSGKVPTTADLQIGEIAINLADGKIYTRNATGVIQLSSSGGGGSASVTIGTTPPSTPTAGQFWYDSQNGALKVYYADADSSQWVDVIGTVVGPIGPAGPTGPAGPNLVSTSTATTLTGVLYGNGVVVSSLDQSTAANTVLPSQAGNAGEFLTTDGTNVSWAFPTSNVTVTTYTSGSGTWTKPATGTFARVRLWGGGGSGGKNVDTVTGYTACGGGGGGYFEATFRLVELNATEAYSVAAGGAAVTATTTTNGNPGGNTTFKNLTAFGGNRGLASAGVSITTRAAGGILWANGSSGVNAPPTNQIYVGIWDGAPGGAYSGSGNNVTSPYNSIYGGGGGAQAGDNTNFTAYSGGTSVFGGAGGASNATAGGSASAGSAPAGGGGAKILGTSGSSGAGGDGRIEIWVW